MHSRTCLLDVWFCSRFDTNRESLADSRVISTNVHAYNKYIKQQRGEEKLKKTKLNKKSMSEALFYYLRATFAAIQVLLKPKLQLHEFQ